jgi:UDP-glucose 4-epimerase
MMPENIKLLKGKKILVTGGAGFIGSHIVDRLAPENDVTVFDNLYHGIMDNLARSRDRIKFVSGDMLDKGLITKLVNENEYIFHLAAHASVIRSLEEPEFDMKVNINGTLNLLEACRHAGIKRLVYSSSAAIFGDAEYLPVDEKHPLNPKSPYAVSKMAAEKYIMAYYLSFGIPAVSLRYFNMYGPRQDTSEYANVISVFFNKFRARQPITIYGDGEQTRDLIYVQDAVTANIVAATHPKAVGEVFNIATGKATTINKVFEIVQQVSGWKGKINYAPERAGEIKHSLSSINKAKQLLGYQTAIDLEQGIKLTWDATK